MENQSKGAKLLNKKQLFFIKLVLSILLLICLFDMPYSYYQLIRVISFVLIGYFSFLEYRLNRIIFFLIFLIGALIFNPFVKIILTKDIWVIIDIIYASLIFITGIIDIKNINTKKIS